MLIIQKCLKHADKLYEKFSQSVNRKTQMSKWQEVADELTSEGTAASDVHKLKQNVRHCVFIPLLKIPGSEIIPVETIPG